MNRIKHIFVGILIFMFFAIPILFSAYSNKKSLNISRLIENENIEDISLTIYHLSPHALMFYPVSSVEDLIHRSKDDKIVINGSDLEEHIDLFRQISNDVLIPVRKKTTNLDLRMYYVLESKKNGKLIDVAMWGDEDNIFVNGFEVKENNIFYDVVIPFLPENEVKELAELKISNRKLSSKIR